MGLLLFNPLKNAYDSMTLPCLGSGLKDVLFLHLFGELIQADIAHVFFTWAAKSAHQTDGIMWDRNELVGLGFESGYP